MINKPAVIYFLFLMIFHRVHEYNIFFTKSTKSAEWKDSIINKMGSEFSPHKTCLPPSQDKRYSFVRTKKYFIAINLHDNQEILPQMLGNILELMTVIRPSNLFLSIFESGSNDMTKGILLKFFELIKPLNVQFEIFTSPLSRKRSMNRIEYLAYVRNLALEPLFKEMEVAESNAKFFDHPNNYNAVIFLNDVYFCVNDVLELLYQQALNDASMVSGMDYDAPNGLPHFYDVWVAHLTSGRNARKEFLDQISDDTESNERLSKMLPVQMSCVWNGISVMHIGAFQKGIRFRRGNNVRPKMNQPGECAGSECMSLCLDFIRNGFSKIMMVPRVKVAFIYDR
eukprot:NODE_406_length_7988_cov_0.615794.p3 type:complete len:340 gc:universal NODE_406_length_7988_cov_0.615794:1397-378(-)